MQIGDKLAYLRKSHKYSQKELADKLNTSRSSIAMFESNARIPTTSTLSMYANLFGVSVDYLLGSDTPVKGKDYITINVYGSIPAGIPIEAIEDISDTEDISLKEYDKNTVIIEKTPDCENGTDAAVYVNGYEATLKTVIKNPNGTITLRPINPNYPPKTYGPGDDPVRILGIVKEIRRKI